MDTNENENSPGDAISHLDDDGFYDVIINAFDDFINMKASLRAIIERASGGSLLGQKVRDMRNLAQEAVNKGENRNLTNIKELAICKRYLTAYGRANPGRMAPEIKKTSDERYLIKTQNSSGRIYIKFVSIESVENMTSTLVSGLSETTSEKVAADGVESYLDHRITCKSFSDDEYDGEAP
ncbi:hypothetical protein [Ancylobacter oerskovii]|uniref:Uncharacterized protein n=1 Tax=Ancylobacter oerskovii TaxID=459519 RepID=A0ABW4Z5S9_9HYPH|nr:hypothetical protein [Ancylobacter oerskovii]MBS7543085.1 hypothetical protein [Ancylobacter oerskovii]